MVGKVCIGDLACIVLLDQLRHGNIGIQLCEPDVLDLLCRY